MNERIKAQATHSSVFIAGERRQYEVDLVCYGIGRFSTSHPSQLQLAVLLALRSSLPVATDCSIQLYDPLLSSLEWAVLSSVGISAIEHNEEAKRCVSRCTVFYMPHCGQALYNNLLWANWGWCHGSGDERRRQQQQQSAAGDQSREEKKEKAEQLTEDDTLSSALCSVHLSSTHSPPHLGHVILIGNQLSAYIDKRSFPSTHTTPPTTRTTNRRSAQQPSYLSTRCPTHSPTPPPSTSPSSVAVCQYECVCLVDALGLLRCRGFESELRECGEEMALAFHDTAVQWFDWSEVGGGEKEREKQWLQYRLTEPKQLADDGELVTSAQCENRLGGVG